MTESLPPTRWIGIPRPGTWGAVSETLSTTALVDQIVAAMTDAWKRGECPRVEYFLEQYPKLKESPEAALRLLYEEIRLERESGRDVSREEVLRRFPQWHQQLRLIVDGVHGLQDSPPAPSFPQIGETMGEFYVLAELGRGALGRVYLATQTSLSNRPVVLKMTRREVKEHLSLARLQHTHIMPLHFVQELPERNLRILCEPYLGTTTMAQLLGSLRDRPLGQRTGRDVLRVLDRTAEASPVQLPAQGPARHLIESFSYAETICWMAARLAEGLHQWDPLESTCRHASLSIL